jgi:TRAP-type mannitol/chloroaromatic compound transport system permease large subunit
VGLDREILAQSTDARISRPAASKVAQTSFLTPPFGWALFFLKGVAPPQITTLAIYRGVLPFIGIQLVGLALLFLFPELATWLPDAIGW